MANNNGLRLLRTCVDHDLVVTNPFFTAWWCVTYASVSPTQLSVDRGYPPSPAYAWHP